MTGYNCFTGISDKVKAKATSTSTKNTRKMDIWRWFNDEFKNLIFGEPKNQQQRQQKQIETTSRKEFVHPINPPSYESVMNQAISSADTREDKGENGSAVSGFNGPGSIQVHNASGVQNNHLGDGIMVVGSSGSVVIRGDKNENFEVIVSSGKDGSALGGTQIIAGPRHAYAESVPESLTSDCENNVAAAEDYECETKDTDDATSNREKSQQPPKKADEGSTSSPSRRSESTVSHSKAASGNQNNNTGNGTKSNTFSSQTKVHDLNAGRQFQDTVFTGDVCFGPNTMTIRSNGRGNRHHYNKSSYVVHDDIHNQNSNTGNGTQYHEYTVNYNEGTGCCLQNVVFHGDVSFRDLCNSEEQKQQPNGKKSDVKRVTITPTNHQPWIDCAVFYGDVD